MNILEPIIKAQMEKDLFKNLGGFIVGYAIDAAMFGMMLVMLTDWLRYAPKESKTIKAVLVNNEGGRFENRGRLLTVRSAFVCHLGILGLCRDSRYGLQHPYHGKSPFTSPHRTTCLVLISQPGRSTISCKISGNLPRSSWPLVSPHKNSVMLSSAEMLTRTFAAHSCFAGTGGWAVIGSVSVPPIQASSRHFHAISSPAEVSSRILPSFS